MSSAQPHIDLDPTIYSIPEETRSFLLKVVRGIDLLASVMFSFRLSTGQDATEAFEDVGHSDEARALLPGMFVGDFEQDSVSDHTTLLQLHVIAYLSSSEHQVEIRSCRCSRKPNVRCCRARLEVRLSFRLLFPITHSSLNS